MSVLARPAMQADVVHSLESITQGIVAVCRAHQKNGRMGEVPVRGGTVSLPSRPMAPSEWGKLHRLYFRMNAMNAPTDLSSVAAGFVAFLNNNLE